MEQTTKIEDEACSEWAHGERGVAADSAVNVKAWRRELRLV